VVLVAVFLGGRLTAPDNRVPTVADAVRQAEAGLLPCGSLTNDDKALQKLCVAPPARGSKNRTQSPATTSSQSTTSTTTSSAN